MKHVIAAVFLALTAATAPAQAALLTGKCLDYQYLYPASGIRYANADNGLKCVGEGIEVRNVVDGIGTLDLGDDFLEVRFGVNSSFNEAWFNGFRLSDVTGSIDLFAAIGIDPLSNLAGFSMTRIRFDADTLWVDWQGLAFGPQTVLRLNFVGALPRADEVHAVPEPGSLLLATAALIAAAVVAGQGRRRQSISGRVPRP